MKEFGQVLLAHTVLLVSVGILILPQECMPLGWRSMFFLGFLSSALCMYYEIMRSKKKIKV